MEESDSFRQKRVSVFNGEECLEEVQVAVLQLLKEEWPKYKNSSMLETWRARDDLMSSAGPPCVVVSAEALERLGRIPRFDEGESLSLPEAAKIAADSGKRFFLEMFSHRWCGRERPDDASQSKARALLEWARYRSSNGFCSFFWIDYACIDQMNIHPGVAMLPLYVASMNNIICFETDGMEGRAWCRIERIMFASFCAPTQDIISTDFVFGGDSQQKPAKEEYVELTDATRGELSCASDVDLIRQLLHIAAENWGYCWKDGLLKLVQTSMNSIDTLNLGATQVRARLFSDGSCAFLDHLRRDQQYDAAQLSAGAVQAPLANKNYHPVERLCRAFHLGGAGSAPPSALPAGGAHLGTASSLQPQQQLVRRGSSSTSVGSHGPSGKQLVKSLSLWSFEGAPPQEARSSIAEFLLDKLPRRLSRLGSRSSFASEGRQSAGMRDGPHTAQPEHDRALTAAARVAAMLGDSWRRLPIRWPGVPSLRGRSGERGAAESPAAARFSAARGWRATEAERQFDDDVGVVVSRSSSPVVIRARATNMRTQVTI